MVQRYNAHGDELCDSKGPLVAYKAYAVLEAENERLLAIVNRLETTNDGVPMVPGDVVYVVAQDYLEDDEGGVVVIRCKYMAPTDPKCSAWPFEAGDPANELEVFDVLSVWSTRPAAEAAIFE